jgi:hypothetical protein
MPDGLSTDDAAQRIAALLSQEDSGPGSEPETPAKPEASDTPSSAEAEESATPAEESETPSEEPAETEITVDPKTFKRKLKVDGQEVEVTLEEMEKSYSFQAYNTRNAQKNAEERKAIEAERVAVRTDRERYAKILPQLEEIVTQQLDPYANVDWARLQAEDPNAFAQHRAAYDLQRERLAKIKAEQERITQEAQAEQQKEMSAYLEAERGRLLEAVPDWKDDAKRTAELTEIAREAKQAYGIGDEDLVGFTAAWQYLALRDAIKYRQLQKNTDLAKQKVAQVRKTAAPPAKAGAPKPKPATARSLETLKQSGKVQDAASALLARLEASS